MQHRSLAAKQRYIRMAEEATAQDIASTLVVRWQSARISPWGSCPDTADSDSCSGRVSAMSEANPHAR